jgi:hypothetical protein
MVVERASADGADCLVTGDLKDFPMFSPQTVIVILRSFPEIEFGESA